MPGKDIMGTSVIYRSLSDEQKAVLRTKTIDAEKTPQEWLMFLRPLAAYDRKRDKSSRWLKGLAIASGILVFFSVFFLVSSELEVGWSGLIGGAVVLVLALWRYWHLKAVNIEGDLNKLVVPVLHILKEELPAQGKLQLQLNLCALEKAEQIKETPKRKVRVVPGVTTQLFRKPWFSGTTQLADGTVLRMRITDLVKKVEKTKRKTRGRTKTKLKYKQQSVLSLAMGFRADTYAVRASHPQTQGKIAIRSSEKRHWVKLQRRTKFPARMTTEPDAIALDTVMGTIAAAFQHVAPMRKAQ